MRLVRQRLHGFRNPRPPLSDLELPGMPFVAPITGISEAISGCQNVNYIMCTKLFGGLVGR